MYREDTQRRRHQPSSHPHWKAGEHNFAVARGAQQAGRKASDIGDSETINWRDRVATAVLPVDIADSSPAPLDWGITGARAIDDVSPVGKADTWNSQNSYLRRIRNVAYDKNHEQGRRNRGRDYWSSASQECRDEYRYSDSLTWSSLQETNNVHEQRLASRDSPKRTSNLLNSEGRHSHRKHSVGSIEEHYKLKNSSPRKIKQLPTSSLVSNESNERLTRHDAPNVSKRRASVAVISCSPMHLTKQSVSEFNTHGKVFSRNGRLNNIHNSEPAATANSLIPNNGAKQNRRRLSCEANTYGNNDFNYSNTISDRRGSCRRYSDASDIDTNTFESELRSSELNYGSRGGFYSSTTSPARSLSRHKEDILPVSKPGINVAWDEERRNWVLKGNFEETARIASEEILIGKCGVNQVRITKEARPDYNADFNDSSSHRDQNIQRVQSNDRYSSGFRHNYATVDDDDPYYEDVFMPSTYERDEANISTNDSTITNKPKVSEIRLKSGVLIRYDSSDNKYHAYFENDPQQNQSAASSLERNDRDNQCSWRNVMSRDRIVPSGPSKDFSNKIDVSSHSDVCQPDRLCKSEELCKQLVDNSSNDVSNKSSIVHDSSEINCDNPCVDIDHSMDEKINGTDQNLDIRPSEKNQRRGSAGFKYSAELKITPRSCNPTDEDGNCKTNALISLSNQHQEEPGADNDSPDRFHNDTEDGCGDDADSPSLEGTPRKQSACFTYTVNCESSVEASVTVSSFGKSTSSEDLNELERTQGQDDTMEQNNSKQDINKFKLEETTVIDDEYCDEADPADDDDDDDDDDREDRKVSRYTCTSIPPIVVSPDVESVTQVTQHLTLSKLKDITSNWLSTAR